jgi:hypothetical protein
VEVPRNGRATTAVGQQIFEQLAQLLHPYGSASHLSVDSFSKKPIEKEAPCPKTRFIHSYRGSGKL